MCGTDIKYFQILFVYKEFSTLCLFRKSEVRTEAFIEIFDSIFNNCDDTYSKKKKPARRNIWTIIYLSYFNVMYNVKSFEKSAKRCARIFLHLQFPDTIIEMNLILNEMIHYISILNNN